jgi:hypothetical protein
MIFMGFLKSLALMNNWLPSFNPLSTQDFKNDCVEMFLGKRDISFHQGYSPFTLMVEDFATHDQIPQTVSLVYS